MTTTSTESMPPSEARDAIFEQHEVLRGLLSATVELACETVATEVAFEGLRVRARTLYDTLAEHMTFEELVLSTALRDVIGWGAALHAQIVEDHERQRAELASAIFALGPAGLSGVELVESVRAFASTLLTDMEREERGLLQADFDAITTDGEGG